MFESDQHEFDEEYEGYRHPAPASPPTAQAAPVTESAPTAQTATGSQDSSAVGVLEPTVGEDSEAQEEEPEENQEEVEDYVDPAEKKPEPPKRKKPNLVLIGAAAAIVGIAVLVMLTYKPKENVPVPGDLGPGIVAVSGLRGHLATRWDGDIKTGRVTYQLRIEPMEDRWGPGFSKVTLNPPMPMYVNIRLLDSTGFALCGKEIDFPFHPQNGGTPLAIPAVENGKRLSAAERSAAMQAARQTQIAQMQAQETAREHGKDIFQNQTTTEGQVSAVNVQGALPCSPDQFRRVDYWDFNTNFPTLEEQAALLDPKAAALAKRQLEEESHPGGRKLSKLPQQGFVMQGDDRVTGYDSAHGLLQAENRTFQIDRRSGQATANAWASNYSLIHYRCDQHANCALTAAGEAAVLHARLSE